MQNQLDQFLIELQDEVSNNITLSNSLILFRKGVHSTSHFEAAECFTKTLILLSQVGRINQHVSDFFDTCQQYLDAIQPKPYILNDCKITLTESLEQIHHIDKLEDRISFLIKRWNIILVKGGLITQHILFKPKIFIPDTEHKYKTALFKNAVSAIDKMTVLYKFTPEAELGSLSVELREQLMVVYKDYCNKKIKTGEDLLYWLQMFYKSSTQLHELISERSARIDKQTKLNIYAFLQKFMEICLLEIITQIKNNLKKPKVSQLI